MGAGRGVSRGQGWSLARTEGGGHRLQLAEHQGAAKARVPRGWEEGPGLPLCRRKAGERGRTLPLEAEQEICSWPGREVEAGSCSALPSWDRQLGRALVLGSSGTNQQEEVS